MAAKKKSVKKKSGKSTETRSSKKVTKKKAAATKKPAKKVKKEKSKDTGRETGRKAASEAGKIGSKKPGKSRKTAPPSTGARTSRKTRPGSDLLIAAERAAKGALKVKPAEQVVLVTDSQKLRIAEALAFWFNHIRAETTTYLLIDPLRPMKKLTGLLKSMVGQADLTVCLLETQPDEKSFRRDLVDAALVRGRICMMPGITVSVMERLVNLNYGQLRELGKSLVERLSGAREVRVTNPLGTDVTFSVFGRRWLNDNGDISQRGLQGNLPAGECFTSPVEETFKGVIQFSLVDSRVGKGMVRFKKGRVVDHKGKSISDILDHIGRDAGGRVIGEVGIGTNMNARICNNLLEAEKAFGSVHFAIGDSAGLGPNKSKHHYDMLVEKATVVADGQVILKDGEFQF